MYKTNIHAKFQSNILINDCVVIEKPVSLMMYPFRGILSISKSCTNKQGTSFWESWDKTGHDRCVFERKF